VNGGIKACICSAKDIYIEEAFDLEPTTQN
jgi:hypothetical protein